MPLLRLEYEILVSSIVYSELYTIQLTIEIHWKSPANNSPTRVLNDSKAKGIDTLGIERYF